MTDQRIRVFADDARREAYEAEAKKRNQSVSEFLRDAADAQLPAKIRAKLPPVRPAGRPKKESDNV